METATSGVRHGAVGVGSGDAIPRGGPYRISGLRTGVHNTPKPRLNVQPGNHDNRSPLRKTATPGYAAAQGGPCHHVAAAGSVSGRKGSRSGRDTGRERRRKCFGRILDAAGIPYRDPQGRVYDFHALRHQYITDLYRAGAHPKVIQTLARHSTIRLTMDRYTHAPDEDLQAALEGLPPPPKLSRRLNVEVQSAVPSRPRVTRLPTVISRTPSGSRPIGGRLAGRPGLS